MKEYSTTKNLAQEIKINGQRKNMIFQSLRKVYESQSIEFQNKAPAFATFTTVLFTIIFVASLTIFINEESGLLAYLPILVELILLIVAFGLLYKRKYSLSVNIVCYTMLAALIYRHFYGPDIENIALLTLNMLFIVMVTAFFCTTKKELGIISGTGLIVILLYFNIVLPASMQDNKALMGSFIFYLLFTIISFFLFSARKNNIRNIEKLTHTVVMLEEEVEKRKAAEKEIKVLGGLLPICSNCKKIRDDKGYWEQMESYIDAHSEAKFSHSICPECAKELYPDFDLSG